MKDRRLVDRNEQYESEVIGACQCGENVVKVIGSSVTISKNKVRYRYPESNSAWNTFRCRNCGEVIEESFIPDRL